MPVAIRHARGPQRAYLSSFLARHRLLPLKLRRADCPNLLARCSCRDQPRPRECADRETLAGPHYTFAPIKNPLVVPATRGYGLDDWLQIYQEHYHTSRTITRGYRDPVQNARGTPGAPDSRHMFGDAIDFQNVSRSPIELQQMNDTAYLAGASFVEDVDSTYSCATSLRCAHADWRITDRNKYAQ